MFMATQGHLGHLLKVIQGIRQSLLGIKAKNAIGQGRQNVTPHDLLYVNSGMRLIHQGGADGQEELCGLLIETAKQPGHAITFQTGIQFLAHLLPALPPQGIEIPGQRIRLLVTVQPPIVEVPKVLDHYLPDQFPIEDQSSWLQQSIESAEWTASLELVVYGRVMISRLCSWSKFFVIKLKLEI